MATATQIGNATEQSAAQVATEQGAGQVESAPGSNAAPAESPPRAGSQRPDQYRCECGHVLRVFGGGRHRRYFEVTDARLDEPVMDRACPQCGRGLPGKNQP